MRSTVRRILAESGTATGVEVEMGPANARSVHRVNAGVVVSNADLLFTLERLLDPHQLDADRLAAIRKLRPTHPCFLTHIGLKDMPTETLREAAGYRWSSWDSEQVATRAFKVFVPTLYEPAMAPAGCHIVIVQKSTEIDYDAIDDWPAHKLAVENYIMRNLERVMPGFSEKIVVKLSASARTSHQFTGNHHGAMLGWEMSPDQLGENRPALNGMLKNLYFTGHWTQPGGGITPVIVSAMEVAHRITKGKEGYPNYPDATLNAIGRGDFSWAAHERRERGLIAQDWPSIERKYG